MSSTQAARTPSTPLAAAPWFPLHLATLAGSAAVVAGLAAGDTQHTGWQLATRWTARTSACFFLLVFLAGPLWRSRKALWIGPIMRNRRYWGLAFAIAHFIHLGALTLFFVIGPEDPAPIAILGGGFGYVLLALMTLTSNNAAQRAMGAWWTRVHTFGMIYLWVIFTQSYVGRLFDPERVWTGIIGTGLFAAAILLRLTAARRTT